MNSFSIFYVVINEIVRLRGACVVSPDFVRRQSVGLDPGYAVFTFAGRRIGATPGGQSICSI
jgi:hypothetical protein